MSTDTVLSRDPLLFVPVHDTPLSTLSDALTMLWQTSPTLTARSAWEQSGIEAPLEVLEDPYRDFTEVHNQSALVLKARLLYRPNTVVTSVPWHID